MLEKAFRAKRFDDALAKVKDALGPDAVIVSTRQLGGTNGARGDIEVRALPYSDAMRLGYGSRAERETLSPNSFARWLQHSGVPADAARTLARRVSELYGGDPPNLATGEPLLAQALEEEMYFRGPLGQRIRTIALVGPTGVGKTTTIAKLATFAAFVDMRRVAFISLDQYRIGGADQLQRYAELIECPMETAHDTRSLEIALRRLERADRIYIDTAGRSPRDIAAIGELSECLHGVDEPVEVALCLPAAIREAELEVTVDVLSPLRPTRLVMTKLDEAVFFGSVVAAHVRTGLPLSYFTTGQRVPEDVEVADPVRLAALLCSDDEKEEES